MNIIAKKRSAESLIETIIAITVISLTVVSSSALIKTALKGNQIIGEKIVALNLATESLEAVKNIIDTNSLNFANNTDECWDTLDGSDSSLCASADHIASGINYALYRNFEPYSGVLFEWSLIPVTSDENTVSLYVYTPNSGTNSTLLYAQNDIAPHLGLISVAGKESAFKRTISSESDSAFPDDIWKATAKIEWEEKTGTKSISLTRAITNSK